MNVELGICFMAMGSVLLGAATWATVRAFQVHKQQKRNLGPMEEGKKRTED